MSAASMAISEFRVGQVLSRSMAILARNIVPFMLLAVLFTAPTTVATIFVESESGIADPKLIQAMEYGDEAAIRQFVIWLVATFALLILGFILTMMATAAMVYGTFQDLRGAPAGIGIILRQGLRTMLPVLGVVVLYVLAMMLGFVLLFIPMFIVLVMYWVAIPAAVVERPGVIASLKRSAALTKGYRWPVFGIYVVIALVAVVASSMAQAPVAVGTVVSGAEATSSGAFIISSILALFVSAFFTALSAVASAVAYHDLRAVKEGFDIDQFASVFD